MILYTRDEELFNANDLQKQLREAAELSHWDVMHWSLGQLERFSDDEIVDQILTHRFPEPLTLCEGKAQRSQEESGDCVTVVITVPYTGDSSLWASKPGHAKVDTAWGFGFGKAGTKEGKISFTSYCTPNEPDTDFFVTDIQKRLQAIRVNVEAIRVEIEEWREEVTGRLRKRLAERRDQAAMTKEKLSRITIPLVRAPSAPALDRVPLQRKVVPPLPAAKPAVPEYAIFDTDYEYILKVIRHEGATFETTRVTFAKLNEEDVRNIIRAHLNGHLGGEAHGEAFRGAGKTDILIEFENRAAFVAECKNWGGEKVLHDALDQLLGYLTWRDCKTALILFNMDRQDFAAIQEKMPELLSKHPYCLRTVNAGVPGEWRIVCRSAKDAERLVTVHVFLFDLTTQEANHGS